MSMLISPRRIMDPLSIAPSGWISMDPAYMYQTGTRGSVGSAVAADGDPVGLILDKSGNNIDLTQGTAGSRPVYRRVGGLDCIELDGSDDWLSNVAPGLSSTGYPLSIGAWFSPDTLDRVLFCYSDTGAAAPSSRFLSGGSSPGGTSISARASGPPQNGTQTSTSQVAGSWYYAVWRYISTTNRRVSVILPNGNIEHAQNVTSTAPTSLDAIFLGCQKHSDSPASLWDGKVYELWWKNTDIQGDGLQLSDTTLRRLAFGGPAL